jgi:hypothetical protein
MSRSSKSDIPTRLSQVVVLGLSLGLLSAGASRAEQPHWYRGNTHAHTLWSDGSDLPEMMADSYKSHGYDFLALSDHDRLMQGQKWVDVADGPHHASRSVLQMCEKRFGSDWLQFRDCGEKRQVKLKTFEEVKAKLDEPGKFLLIQGEEISDSVDKWAVHLGAINLAEPITTQGGKTVVEAIRADLAAVEQQAECLHRPILTQVNHPNYAGFSISAEDLAEAPAARFCEIANAHPGVRNAGDAAHPNMEKEWDVANTIRIGKMKAPPLFGIGSDDAHCRHDASHAPNLRSAWIVVRARELTAEAILAAMNRGDFYASTGVTLSKMEYDPKQRAMSVAVKAEPGVGYTIEFIGTLEGVDPSCEPVEIVAKGPKPVRRGRKYSPEVGKVLSSVKGTSACYRLTGKELFVRAVVRSDKPVRNAPPSGFRLQTAWCQPVGWEK